jgi:hypothetical protein
MPKKFYEIDPWFVNGPNPVWNQNTRNVCALKKERKEEREIVFLWQISVYSSSSFTLSKL